MKQSTHTASTKSDQQRTGMPMPDLEDIFTISGGCKNTLVGRFFTGYLNVPVQDVMDGGLYETNIKNRFRSINEEEQQSFVDGLAVLNQHDHYSKQALKKAPVVFQLQFERFVDRMARDVLQEVDIRPRYYNRRAFFERFVVGGTIAAGGATLMASPVLWAIFNNPKGPKQERPEKEQNIRNISLSPNWQKPENKPKESILPDAVALAIIELTGAWAFYQGKKQISQFGAANECLAHVNELLSEAVTSRCQEILEEQKHHRS